MKKELFDELLESVREGGAILRGEREPSRRFTFEEPDVRDLREKHGLSQPKFAAMMGISVGTLRNWEQGRRKPEGRASVAACRRTAPRGGVRGREWRFGKGTEPYAPRSGRRTKARRPAMTSTRARLDPWYALSKSMTKRKISVSLDEGLVEELKREDESLSAQVNSAVSAELERRRRHRLVVEMPDQLDAENGPVDESLVAKYVGLLE